MFYAFGIFGIFWLVFWFVLIYNHPNRHPFISTNEKQYLNRVINTVDPDDVSIITINTIKCYTQKKKYYYNNNKLFA